MKFGNHCMTSVLSTIEALKALKTSPLVNKRSQSWIFETGKLQFVTKQGVCFNEFLELNQHYRSSRLGISIFRQLFILPTTQRIKPSLKQFLYHHQTSLSDLLPEILQCQKVCYLLKQVFIKRRENFKILYKDFNSLGPITPITNSHTYSNWGIR